MRKVLLAFLTLIIYQNVFGQTFTQDFELPTGLRSGSVSWGDINKDGLLDFIQTGNDIDANATTRLYINTTSSFVLLNTNLPNIFEGASDFGDYDKDGDEDLLLAGSGSDGLKTRLYDNVNGVLVLNSNVSLHGIDRGSVEWGDYDKDGDLDILLSGQDSESSSVTKIYNNENGDFSEVSTEITGVSFGVTAWVDFDSDGDLDIMISGITGTVPNTGSAITKLYENTGSSFTQVFQDSFEGLSESSMDFGDYDNDGDLDILISGITETSTPLTAIYQNNSSTFDVVFSGILPNVIEGQVLWGDTDNDGDLDVFISGNLVLGNEKIAVIYSNTGTGFESTYTFKEAGQSAAQFGDYDNDGDLDLFVSGQRNDYSIYSAIYKNDNSNEILADNANTLPVPPENLSYQIRTTDIIFSWDMASDDNTPELALTYDLNLRNESDTLIAAHALIDGKRKLIKRGNSGSVNSFIYNVILVPGDYYWRVQSIDNSLAGSSFTNEELVHINFPPIISGPSSPLSTAEDTPIIIEFTDLDIEDPDNDYPDDFTLQIFDAQNFTVSDNEVIPDLNYFGPISVPVKVNDGTDDSEVVAITIEITPVNDPPIITSYNGIASIRGNRSLTLSLADLSIEDVDNPYPDDFTLAVLDGENYSVTGSEVVPDPDFIGTINVPIRVNDGTDNSDDFVISFDVTEPLGFESFQVDEQFSFYPNPATNFITIKSYRETGYLLTIYSIHGQLVYTTTIDSGSEKSINISDFKNGLYLMYITLKDKQGIMELIKK